MRNLRLSLIPLALACGVLSSSPAQAQTSRGELSAARTEKARQEKSAAESLAKKRGWPVEGKTAEGRGFELMTLAERGAPLYNITMTTEASIMVNAVALQSTTPTLTGEGLIIGIWDQGGVLETHQEFADGGGGSRAQNADGAGLANHSHAVTSVVIGAGVNPECLGAAPDARSFNYDWDGDDGEMTAVAAHAPGQPDRVPVSNHSYGYVTGWQSGSYSGNSGWHWFGSGWDEAVREDFKFGLYSTDTEELDAIMWENPYFLVFWPTGNDRNDVYGGARDGTETFYWYVEETDSWAPATWESATAPFDDLYDGGFDTLVTRTTSKNGVSVGAIGPGVTGGMRDPAAAVMTSFSGWGPTDDGRLKPDLVGKGGSMLMAIGSADDAYTGGGSNGTSYASPNVAGAALLLVDAAASGTHPWSPRASTVKALLIHGATDMGRPGPDYEFGWGLPDLVESKAPMDALASGPDAAASPLVEALLDPVQAPSHVYTFEWDGTRPLRATLCWTDPPGSPTVILDDPTPQLVHDLDLRIEGPGGTTLPFVLDPANPANNATTGDNVVDPVEQVLLPAGGTAGVYTATVSAKTPLAEGPQWYSLVITGQSPSAAPAPLGLTAVDATTDLGTGMVALAVTGAVFHPGTQLRLEDGEGSALELTGEIVAPGDIAAAVDLPAVDGRNWDLVVTRPDGATATWPDAIRLGPSTVTEWRILGGTE